MIFLPYPDGTIKLKSAPSVELMRQWLIITENPIIGWKRQKLNAQNRRESKKKGCHISEHPLNINLLL